MNDLERVARAICVNDGLDPDAPVSLLSWAIDKRPGVKPGDQNWKDYIEFARAAIEALMDVSKEMVISGDDALEEATDYGRDSFGSYTSVRSDAPAAIFKAMLRAVLEGK